jgi:uncharacterized protein (TIGR00730 family)
VNVCIFAASSSRVESHFFDEADELGTMLAQAGAGVVFGGGGIGLMGRLADAVLRNNGHITGVIPAFMKKEGWGHDNLSEEIITPDMNERKKKMFSISDSVIALPGGIGTVEELTEALTLKQLSLWRGPIVILNSHGYYDSLFEFFDKMVEKDFLRFEHKAIWEVVSSPAEAVRAALRKPGDDEEWRKIAKI